MLELPEQRVECTRKADEDARELAKRAAPEQVSIRQAPEKQADADESGEVDADAAQHSKSPDRLMKSCTQRIRRIIPIFLLARRSSFGLSDMRFTSSR